MHTALCHSFTSGLTLSSAEPGKHPEVVKMGAGDISQLSEQAQSVFSSLTLQPGRGGGGFEGQNTQQSSSQF